jgi:hypothetical protein
MPPAKPKSSGIDEAIDSVLFEMRGYTADTDEYAAMVDQLVKLHALKVKETRSRVSPDVVVAAVVNLAGIFMIIRHEQINVITTKALSFVMKPR